MPSLLLHDLHEPLGPRISSHIEVTRAAVGIVTRLFHRADRQVLVLEIHDRIQRGPIRSQRDTGLRHPQRPQELEQEFIRLPVTVVEFGGQREVGLGVDIQTRLP